MKVKELIEHLSSLDGDLEVFTAVDDEGNGYNSTYFEPTETWLWDGDSSYDRFVVDDEDLVEYDTEELKRVVII